MSVSDAQGFRTLRADPPVLVVGVGASAGGIEPLQKLLSDLPRGCGLSILVMFHLDPEIKSLLPEVLAKSARLPVAVAGDGTRLEPDRIYTIPGHSLVRLENGVLRLRDAGTAKEQRGVIDQFLIALAEDQRERAVAIVLSGAGTDGSIGLKAVALAGGLTMVQDPRSAAHSNMPRAAVDTGVADHVLPPSQLAAALLAYAELRESASAPQRGAMEGEVQKALPEICEILRKATGHDFKDYKSSTLVRRTVRRIQVLSLANAAGYVAMLRADRAEADRLLKELLINVTAFFRDPDAFVALDADVLATLLDNDRKEPVRIWVPGCATGEEAYTLAILMQEYLEKLPQPPDLQVFATDVDEAALSVARIGVYSLEIGDDVSAERLRRFFVKKGNGYQIGKQIRERVLFSAHNLVNDPPFSKLDLISCRNLLIYLGAPLQQKLAPLFHYALRPGGYLLLGTSESFNNDRDLFRPVNAKHRIFQRLPTEGRGTPQLTGRTGPLTAFRARGGPSAADADTYSMMQRLLLDEFAPRAVVVNDDGQVIAVSGNLERYLTVHDGVFQNSISRLVRPSLRLGLRAALGEAVKLRRRVVHDTLSLRTDAGLQRVMLTVEPMTTDGDPSLFLLVFQDMGLPVAQESAETAPSGDAATALIEQLERELARTREDLEKTVQDLEAANEELKASNEELLSMNEELQSTNEELESSKEELQAANTALGASNSDLENLLASTRIATLFLDDAQNVRRVTAAAAAVYNLTAADAGRPLEHFTHKATLMPPLPDVASVYEAQATIEDEVEMRDGTWFVRRVTPYRTAEGKQEGIVATFIDVTERKRAEDEMRYQLARTRSITDNATTALFTIDATGRCTFANPAAEQITGYTATELVGQILSDKIYPVQKNDPADAGKDDSAVRALRGGVELRNHLDSFVRKDGSVFPVLVSTRVIFQKDVAVGAVIEVRDITEQRLAARSLRESEANFLELAETISHLAWMARPDGHIFWYNKRWYEYTGTTLEQMEGWGWQTVHDPKVLPDVMKQWSLAIATGTHFEMVFPIRGADGAYRPFLTRAVPLKNDDGRVRLWVGTNTDVSGERSAAETLRRRERELQTLADNTPDIVTRFDRQLRHIFVSAAVERATGKPPAAFLGKTHREAGVPRELADGWTEALGAVIESGRPASTEFRFMTPEGPRDFVANLLPEFGSSGEVEHVLSFARDCTTEKAATEALQEADRRKDVFLATLAHELRNPLAPIRLAAKMFESDDASRDLLRRSGDIIRRQATRMALLLDDLLDISRITRGGLELRKDYADLHAIVATAIETARPLTEPKTQALELQLPAQPVMLEVDPLRISQVLSNLLTNASKYSDVGATIIVSAAIQEDGLRIAVKDNGIGLRAEVFPRLFEMFSQDQAAIDRSAGGLGIGLALVKGLVELHGGRIEARSEGPNRGSEFIVHLPPSVISCRSRLTTAPSTEARGVNHRRVLIADDNKDAVTSLAMLLEYAGHEVVTAATGLEALEVADRARPDVLILDIGMPGLNGYEVARRIRQEAWGRHAVLIAATGWGQADDVDRARAAGFDHHLTKPIDPDALDQLLVAAGTRRHSN